jgi:hypothetical protein
MWRRERPERLDHGERQDSWGTTSAHPASVGYPHDYGDLWCSIIKWYQVFIKDDTYTYTYYIYVYIPPFNPAIFGGVGQEISQKYFTWPHEIYHPHMFFWLPKEVGGSSGCHILAQRWYMAHPFIFDVRTYIYTYMHAFNQALERPV